MDCNSLISALVGGLLALAGSYLTLRGTKKETEKQECRELIALFYFLNSKMALLVKLGNHPNGVPTTTIISEDEILDVRKRFAVASRALSLSEIGDINSFCSSLKVLEGSRQDCINNNSRDIEIYQEILMQCLKELKNEDGNGINAIGIKIEQYFSKKLKNSYA